MLLLKDFVFKALWRLCTKMTDFHRRGWVGGWLAGGVRVQVLLTRISWVRYRLGSDVSTFQMLQPYIRYPGYKK